MLLVVENNFKLYINYRTMHDACIMLLSFYHMARSSRLAVDRPSYDYYSASGMQCQITIDNAVP